MAPRLGDGRPGEGQARRLVPTNPQTRNVGREG